MRGSPVIAVDRSEPRSEPALLERASRLAGQTLGSLAWSQGRTVSPELRRTKGIAGQIIELALGASSGSRSIPDFEALGIELKTLPLGRHGRPTESTFVATLNLQEPGALRWATSSVRSKLARVLWVPLEGDTEIAWADRRIGNPVVWSPSESEEAVLRDDFELITELVAEGFDHRVDARLGQALQLRPKGRNGRDLRWTLDGEGARVRSGGRAFYLRPSFTASLLPGGARS